MVTEEERETIVALSLEGTGLKDIVEITGIPKSTVQFVLRRYRETGNTTDRPKRGRPRTASTPKMMKIIQAQLRENPNTSMRQMARDFKISMGSVKTLVQQVLDMPNVCLPNLVTLDKATMENRVKTCKEMMIRFSSKRYQNIVFTSEKLFPIQHSSLNNSTSILVFAGVTHSGKTPLHFIEGDVKLNGQNYIDNVLVKNFLPWAKSHFKNQLWTFQQNSTPVHRETLVQEWCPANFMDFINSEEWPLHSPDLNPMDYSVWSVLEEKACVTSHMSINSLKNALTKSWNDIEDVYLRTVINDFPLRLRACVEVNGGAFNL